MKNFKSWFNGLSAVGRVAVVATVSIIFLGTIGATAQPGSNVTPAQIITPSQLTTKPEPKIEIKPISTTEDIPYKSSTINDNTLVQGITQTQTKGVKGVLTHTYQVTYTDGVETSRSNSVDVVTKPAVDEVIVTGTKVLVPSATDCPNGTYVNSAGNTVCSPYESPSAPAGATAQCRDGSYSFSQSRSGTCSHHGGVSIWL